MTPEVLGGVLAAYAVVTLEHDGRIAITLDQHVVIRLVKQAGALDHGDRALLLRADVDQLNRGAALQECLQLRRGQLANRRQLVCRRVMVQRWSILIRQICFGQILGGQQSPFQAAG